MATAKSKLLTADDLLRLFSEGVTGELIRGVLCETVAAGREHGKVVVNLAGELRAFVRPRRLGSLTASDTGIRLERDPDTVREPDIEFTSADRLPLDERVRGYSEVVPDLVVEVVSPSDSPRQVYDKTHMWLNHGVSLVWVVDPETRTIDVYQSGTATVSLTEEDSLDGGQVIPGFTMPVADVFE